MNYAKTNLSKLLLDTPLSYYWAGFIMADGSFINQNNNELSIVLSNIDGLHLEKFANLIKSKCKYSEKFNTVRLSAYSKDYCPLIREKFDFKPRKTYNPPSKLPTNNKELIFSMFAGIIDGDGSIPKQTYREKHYITINCHNSWNNYYSLIDNILFDSTNGLKLDSRKLLKYSIYKQTNLIKLCESIKNLNLPLLERKWVPLFQEFNIVSNLQ